MQNPNPYPRLPQEKSLAAFGPCGPFTEDCVPQFTIEQGMAREIACFETGSFESVMPMRLFFDRPANLGDLIRVAAEAQIPFDPDDEIASQRVASDPLLRKALGSAGFYAFADLLPLFNFECEQIVVFEQTQAWTLDEALCLAEAESIQSQINPCTPANAQSLGRPTL